MQRRKAKNPDVASTLRHGFGHDTFSSQMHELSERVYASRQKAGRLYNLPNEKATFGIKSVKGLDLREIVYPQKTVEELEREAREGHEGYVRSHNSYFVGEKIDRKYDWTHCSKDGPFGILTPHFSDGRDVAKSLQWLGDPKKYYKPKTAWARSTDKKTEPQLGKGIRKKGTTLKLPAEHSFGIIVPPDEFGVGGLLHFMESSRYLKDQERQRCLVNTVQNHLKKINFHNFTSLLQAFRHYDKKGKGMIDKEDLQEVCRQFNVGVSEAVLNDLTAYCASDGDGLINFLEFANFLNWKDKMPLNNKEQLIILNERLTSKTPAGAETRPSSQSLLRAPASQPLIKPEDLEPVAPDSSMRTVRTLRRATAGSDRFTTSSSIIGSESRRLVAPSSRAFGIPSIRADLPLPRIRKMGDSNNYGDAPTVAELLHGVHEQHFFYPRTKTEMAQIFRNVGENMSEETFEEAWKLAARRHPRGDVCVAGFRKALKKIREGKNET